MMRMPIVHFRVSRSDKARLKQSAERAGLSLSEFLRAAVLKRKPVVRVKMGRAEK
jgi:uncharacterized protein (DUF1778 family)